MMYKDTYFNNSIILFASLGRVATSPGKPGKQMEFKKWYGKPGKLKKKLKKPGKNLENYFLSFVELRDLLFALNILR